ncbi:hypothetical protein KY333_02805 [Candidatus Woesearchaeota archaeon]|nr:hypothetical protein [Candidatus Woesearchaeota archaeon]
MTVKAYEPNSTIDRRLRNLFFKSVETSADNASVKNLPIAKFYLFDNCVGFYQPKLFTPVLVLASKDEKYINAAFAKIQNAAANLYVSDETLDHGVSTTIGRKPLAHQGLPTPDWEPAEQDGIKKFNDFLDNLVSNTLNAEVAYDLACQIEDGYRPLRIKEESRTKKSKKKSKKESKPKKK